MATVSHPADSEHLYALVQGYGTNGKEGKKEQEKEGIEPRQQLTENEEAVPVKKTKSEGVSFNYNYFKNTPESGKCSSAHTVEVGFVYCSWCTTKHILLYTCHPVSD